MRVTLSGGIWRNSEDEVLKAGVMKYGLNGWARIASLLPRKTPRQCKARWLEWLDPKVRKVEWSREEDERLLHLARVMPTQWRTIAPMVGRTAAQCVERYERLVEKARGGDASDARRLRPGEIDPSPHTKPARPDAVDMDDDELEMLSEARARLANTKGKKAKRIAREKQLEESKRLAAIRRRRELKAAGIVGRRAAAGAVSADPSASLGTKAAGGFSVYTNAKQIRKDGGLDVSREIAFEHVVGAGPHDATSDPAPLIRPPEMRDDGTVGPVAMAELMGEGAKRAIEKFDRAEKEQKRKDREARESGGVSKPSDDSLSSRFSMPPPSLRPKLSLPKPKVSDAELGLVQRLAEAGEQMSSLVSSSSSSGTDGLVSSMGESMGGVGGGVGIADALPTPLRTPAARVDLMDEARSIIRESEAPTPLAVGASALAAAQLRDGGSQGVGLPTASALAAASMTPRIPPHHRSSRAPSLAPSEAGSVASSVGTFFSTSGSVSSDRTGKRRREGRKGSQMVRLLGEAIPEPSFRYKVKRGKKDAGADGGEAVADQAALSVLKGTSATTLDALDEAEASRAAVSRAVRDAWDARPSAARKGLPRPKDTSAIVRIAKEAVKRAEGDPESESLARAQLEISLEYASLAEHDSLMYPSSQNSSSGGSKYGTARVTPPVPIPESAKTDGSLENGSRGGEVFPREVVAIAEGLIARQVREDGGVPQNVSELVAGLSGSRSVSDPADASSFPPRRRLIQLARSLVPPPAALPPSLGSKKLLGLAMAITKSDRAAKEHLQETEALERAERRLRRVSEVEAAVAEERISAAQRLAAQGMREEERLQAVFATRQQ